MQALLHLGHAYDNRNRISFYTCRNDQPLMKKHLLIYATFLFTTMVVKSQTLCNDIPISYSIDSISFSKADPESFGDSMIVFSMTNDHATQGFAYPLAKLVPLTPLPDGMSLAPNSDPWSVFASSWNSGITMPVYIFYNVELPIPTDYSVTFQVWASNLTPAIPDSCSFDETFTINLNPLASGVADMENDGIVHVFPTPASDHINIEVEGVAYGNLKLTLFSPEGSVLISSEQDIRNTGLDISFLPDGLYILRIEMPGEFTRIVRIVKQS